MNDAILVAGHEVPSLLALAHHVTWCTSGTTYELGTPAQAMRHEPFLREYVLPSSECGVRVLAAAPPRYSI